MPPESSQWNPELIQAGAERVTTLLKARGLNANAELPPLDTLTQQTPDPSLIERFFNWLLKFLPGFSQTGATTDFSPLLTAAYFLGAALLLSLIGYFIYTLVGAERRVRLQSEGAANATPLTDDEKLSRALTIALREGQWAKAARLRWRLSLFRRRQAPSATPREIDKSDRPYDLMFGDKQERAAYQIYDKEIAAVEPPGAK